MLDGASAHTTLPVLDMDRARRFYEEKVGATLADANEAGTFMRIGDSSFALYPTANENRGGHTQMAIRVADVEAAVDELRGRGITFEEYDFPGLKTENGIATFSVGNRAAWFKDSEGNTVGVVQLTAST